jgi:hypothetical protein
MTQWTAIYRNATKQEIQIPLTESNGQFFLETESGKSEPFRATIQDRNLGELAHVRTIAVAEEAPQPFDPARAEEIKTLHAKLAAFPTLDLQRFLSEETKLRAAIDRDFAGVSLETLTAWNALIDRTIKELAAARKAAIPEPVFSQEERRRRFTGKSCGDLFFEEEQIPSNASNDWNGTFGVQCQRCRTLQGYTIRSVDILRMQQGFLPQWKCGDPCVRGR